MTIIPGFPLSPSDTNQAVDVGAELQRLRGFAEHARKSGNNDMLIDVLARIAVLLRDDPGAHSELALALATAERYEESLAPFRWALNIDPNNAAIHCALGNALKYTGRFNKAIAAYRRAVEIEPNVVSILEGLGTALAEASQLDEAVEVFKRALAIDRDAVTVHYNLALAYMNMKRRDDALREFETCLKLDPLHSDAHYNLGLMALAENDEDGALGRFWHATAAQQEMRRRFDTNDLLMPFRLLHEHQQAEYLAARGLLPAAREGWRRTLAELWQRNKDRPRNEAIRLTPEEREALGPSFHEIVYDGGPCLRLPTAINPALDLPKIEDTYCNSSPEIVVIDDLLSPEALAQLRQYCLEATVFKKSFTPGYLNSLIYDGFATPLILQLAQELRTRLPRVFEDHQLFVAWGIKYDSTLKGIPLHADFAAVNVNFWITPDEANLDKESGGLLLWDKESPTDWPFNEYNNAGPIVRKFLQESGARQVRVPHRANRAVVFNSALFHQTDDIHFRDTYEDRRINITLLYGRKLRTTNDAGF
jgi:tetratricopeptide (TPR) repeat protein